MRKALCLLLVYLVCCGITACGDTSLPEKSTVDTGSSVQTTQVESTSTVFDTKENYATTTTASSQATETISITAPSTETPSIPTASPSSTAKSPVVLPSPLADLNVVNIELYDTQLFQTQDAVFIKSITASADIASILHTLTASPWEYYPNFNNWVKYNPIFAEQALVFTDSQNKKWVLHLLSADVGWASLGTFDASYSYTEMIEQAKSHDKERISDFARYKINDEMLDYLLSLF